MTPLELDAKSRTDGTTLAQLRNALPAELHALAPLRSVVALIRAVAVVAAGEAALAALHLAPDASLFWRLPLLVLGWLVVASGLVGLFVLGHDCGHESFARRRWVNSLVGHLCMSPLFTGFHNWRLGHNHHHARTQLRKEDTDWPEKMLSVEEYAAAPRRKRLEARLAYSTPVGLGVGFVVGAVRRSFMASQYPQVSLSARTRRQLRFSNVVMVAVSGGISLGLFLRTGPLGLLKYYLVPYLLGAALGALFTYLHHAGEGALVFDRPGWTPMRGQVVSTFDVRFPAWFEGLFFHINRHLPHHVSPRMPWYHLPAANEALLCAFPDYHQPRRFSLGYLRHCWRVPLLRQIDDGVYVTDGAIDE